MSSAIMEVDEEFKSVARLSSDNRDRFGARRRPRPAFPWLDPRSLVGRPLVEVDFVRCCSVECRMRPMLVVPGEVGSELFAKVRLQLRDYNPARRLVFQGPDEAFDNSDAPMLPDGAKPWANSLAFAPALEGAAPEDSVLVADQILGRNFDASYRSTKKPAYGKRVRPLGKDGEAHRPSRVVINDHGQPPAERPALR